MNISDKPKGGTRKIADPLGRGCMNPQHLPPTHQVFSPGTYEHTCPGCGKTTIFTVPGIWL